MVTLLTIGNSEGDNRCDAKCYTARDPKCTCCCKGMNHAVGRETAMKNTERLFEGLCEKHGIDPRIVIPGFQTQF